MGEISPKSDYAWSSYIFGNPPSKYNSADNKKTLDSDDDAAVQLWGDKWRMPTHDEEIELYENCEWIYTNKNGINGYVVIGPSGNSIFLPLAGLYDGNEILSSVNSGGWYWSSTLNSSHNYARGLYFGRTSVSINIGNHDRCDGHVIRPVYNEKSEYGWQMISDDFNRSMAFTKIRVKNQKVNSENYCCAFFSTIPNNSSTTETNYNINFNRLTIGDRVKEDDSSGYILISNCTPFDDDWYEYEFKQPVYFSHYQDNAPSGQLMAFVSYQKKSKRVIHVAEAGTLSDSISEAEKYTIEELVLTGELNGTDFRLLRDMCGNNYKGYITAGKLSSLDISGASIVAGGDKYLETNNIYLKVNSQLGAGNLYLEIEQNDVFPKYAFIACTIKELILPNSITKIDKYAFNYCKGLSSITIPNSVEAIEQSAFNNCEDLISIIIPSSVTSIGSQAFESCTSLLSVSIPKSVTHLGWGVFSGCSSLSSIVIENGNPIYDSRNKCNAIIETATNTLIRGCSNTIIPNSITEISDGAFSQTGLDSIVIPNSVVNIGSSAFSYCSRLTTVVVENGNTKYDSRDDCNAIIETASNTLIFGFKNSTIPSSVPYIGEGAFRGCRSLTFIKIPETVTSIGKGAFYECRGLLSITIPNSVTRIEESTFLNCFGLESVTIPSSVISIGNAAFQGCNALKEIVSRIFDPFEISEMIFYPIYLNSDVSLIVPKGTKSRYQTTNCWNKFSNIVESTLQFTNDGVEYYPISTDEGTAEVTFGNYGPVLEVPATFTINEKQWSVIGIESGALKTAKELAAIIWEPEVEITEVFDNPNLLLYAKSKDYAPSNIYNVIVNDKAERIVLSDADDSNNFYCPRPFTAETILYNHIFSMKTGINSCQGWETIVLPFDVDMVSNRTGAELVPYSIWEKGGSKYPFWLYSMTDEGWKAESMIKANTPYIISMPNNDSYDAIYNQSGNILFSSSNVEIQASDNLINGKNDYRELVPNYQNIEKSSRIYALNVNNRFNAYTENDYLEGSTFIRGLRQVRPFEAYMKIGSGSSTRGVPIFGEGNATGILNLPTSITDKDFRVYSLSGTLIKNGKNADVIDSLPHGIYIINGKKVIK